MRWVKFTEVLLSQTEDGKLKMAKGPRIIQAELVYSIVPGIVPSEVIAPDGAPVGTPAAYLCISAEHILVESTVSEALYKLTWEGINVEGPEGVNENEFQVTETIKRPIPKSELENESTIIQ